MVVRTKLIPPRLDRVIKRPRLFQMLEGWRHCPLLLVKAEPGYGKSVAVASFLAELSCRWAWCSLAETEAEPSSFLEHLVAALQTIHPTIGEKAQDLLTQEGGIRHLWPSVVTTLVNDLADQLHDEAFLVLDDYHLASCPEVDAIVQRFIEYMPPQFHLALITRHALRWPALPRWRVYGEVVEITQRELAFTPQEVAAFFHERFGMKLSDEEATSLARETEGWVIALQLLGVRGAEGPLRLSGSQSLQEIFSYLVAEVLEQEPPEVRAFLSRTSVLRYLHPTICDLLLDRSDSSHILKDLESRSLFCIGLGPDSYRYHHLFQEMLRSQLDEPTRRSVHLKAAEIFCARGEWEEAVYHFLEAGQMSRAGDLLAHHAEAMIWAGRYETLISWLTRVGEHILDEHPKLWLSLGDCLRLTSDFEGALRAYDREVLQGEVRALMGKILVYLDTVQPARAASLLCQARQLARRTRQKALRREIMALWAENELNFGRLRRAERLQRRAGICDPRLWVRQGRLEAARKMLERAVAQPSARPIPRSHREDTVLLSWVLAALGEGERARALAEQGLRRGRELHSAIIECVAWARLGHSWLCGEEGERDPHQALECYRRSEELAEALKVERFRAEGLLGATLAYGELGNWEAARQHASVGLAILTDSGDCYLRAMQRAALGVALASICPDEALHELREAAQEAVGCGDRYIPCVAHLWMAVLGEGEPSSVLEEIQREGYEFLLVRRPPLGLPRAARVRFLQQALSQGALPEYTRYLLKELESPLGWWPPVRVGCGPPPLYIQTLGEFRVWQGDREIPKEAWGRSKARQLFQMLVRRRSMHREEILEALWPGADPKDAAARLRVALHALQRALEPTRPPGAPPFYVVRQGDRVVLNPEATIVTDVDEFLRQVEEGRSAARLGLLEKALQHYRRALALYRGEYLPEARYEDWSAQEAEQLALTYLTVMTEVAALLLQRGELEEARALCYRVLAKDPCWEEAYNLLIEIYLKEGNRSAALRTYQRCVRSLRERLGVTPSCPPPMKL
jgi:LuxR family maltose regulon positive regulatory protein